VRGFCFACADAQFFGFYPGTQPTGQPGPSGSGFFVACAQCDTLQAVSVEHATVIWSFAPKPTGRYENFVITAGRA
jgi:hypothetical protein